MLSSIIVPLGKSCDKLEFIGCPPGKFLMGMKNVKKEGSAIQSHIVNITRPFWITKFQITKGQWNSYDPHGVGSPLLNALGGLEAPKCDISYASIRDYCEFLAKRVKNKIPKGYVLRLPTEAEWEYAMKANSSDENDPYVRFLNGDQAVSGEIFGDEGEIQKIAKQAGLPRPEHIWGGIFFKVGRKRPNAFGLYDMLGNGWEYTLDTVDGSNWSSPWDSIAGYLTTQLKYQDQETDPLRICLDRISFAVMRGAETHGAVRGDAWTKHRVNVEMGSSRSTFRLCIGPDLMKEKGYTAKAKKR